MDEEGEVAADVGVEVGDTIRIIIKEDAEAEAAVREGATTEGVGSTSEVGEGIEVDKEGRDQIAGPVEEGYE